MTGQDYKTIDDFDIVKKLRRGLFAVIIPQSWYLSSVAIWPAMLNTNQDCKSDGGVSDDKEGWGICHNGNTIDLLQRLEASDNVRRDSVTRSVAYASPMSAPRPSFPILRAWTLWLTMHMVN